MSEASFAELLESSIDRLHTRPGSIIDATVIEVRPDSVVVSAGLKSECFIPINQFTDPSGQIEVTVGDTVEVSLDTIENGNGETRMSRERAKRIRVWNRLKTAFEEGEKVTGMIVSKVKGGFTVNLESVRAFLPGSLVDVRPVRDSNYLENRDLEFKIIKFDRRRDNVVVSRRAVLETEHNVEREEIIRSLSEKDVVRGTIKNLTEYGAFLDLGGIDGLLHITDMAWRRIKHPSDVVQIGQEIDVKILNYDAKTGRVSLGIKQLTPNPWDDFAASHGSGDRIQGTVTSITDYGCFVEVEPGVEGLVHASEMDWSSRNANPSRIVSIGQQVEVMILEIDTGRHRISLGIKQCTKNPWEAFSAMYPKGSVVSGTIRSITDFGIFVGLEGGIDGLVHLSDISWDQPGEEAIHSYRKGNEVDAKVLSVDLGRERISLGIKHCVDDPATSWLREHPEGQPVTGTVTGISGKNVMITLPDNMIGMLALSELADTQAREGQEIEAIVQSFDRKARTVQLSVRAMEEKAVSEYQTRSEQDAPEAGRSLGNMLRDKLIGRKNTDDDGA